MCMIGVFALVLMTGVLHAGTLDEVVHMYGSLRPEVIARFPESGGNLRRMDDGYSRVGIKGTAKLTESLSGFYKYERRVSANDGQDDGAVRSDHNELRQVHVGLSGSAGSISIGRHYGLYYDYIDDELDRHRSHYSDAIVFGDLFVSNAILVQSKEIAASEKANVRFGVLVELNDADATGQSIDERLELAGTLSVGSWSLHAGYVHSPFHDGLLGVASSISFDKVTLSVVFQRFNRGTSFIDRMYSGAIDLAITPQNTIRAAVTAKRNGVNDTDNQIYLIGGIDHRFSKHFLAFAEAFNRSTSTSRPDDETAIITGFRFDF